MYAKPILVGINRELFLRSYSEWWNCIEICVKDDNWGRRLMQVLVGKLDLRNPNKLQT